MGYGHISNFPNGFAYGVNIKGMPVLNTYGGDVYWVDSGVGGDGNKGTFDSPFATLDYAIGRCTANNGDIIMLKPGHAETVATAGAIAVDVAGVTIIGLGDGADRPTFTFSATASTITMSAASCVLKNILIKPSIDSVVSPIVVSAANCTIDVEVQDASATVECVRGILTTAGADNLDIKLKYRGFIAGDACDNAIRLVGVDTARIYVDFYGVASTAVVEFHTTSCHDIDIEGLFYNNGTSLTKNVVDTVGSSTWSVRGWDGNSNAQFSGGDNAALASDDVTALATAISTIDGLHDVPTVNGTADATIRDVVGRKTDAAVGAVGTENSIVGYIKGILTDTIGLVAGQAKGQWVTKSQVVSSGIPNAAQTAAIATVSSGGAWLSDIIIQTNATGLAGPTAVQLTINNANGAFVDATDVVAAEAVASLGANVTLLKTDLDTDALPVFVESGKSVYIQGSDGVGTGAGIADVILKWEAAELGATVAASNVAGT
jgi:hypothetical protein